MINRNFYVSSRSSKLNPDNPAEIAHLRRQWGKFSIQEIADMIKKYGPSRETVERQLQVGSTRR